MNKLAEQEIIWLSDSEVYVADKKLFATANDFLEAVLAHIKQLKNDFSEQECGWFEVPSFGEYIGRVTTSWMVHRINSEWHDAPFWENVEESGRGHIPVWYVDFELKI